MSKQTMTDPGWPVTLELKAQCIQGAAAVARRHHLPSGRVRRWVLAATKPLARHAMTNFQAVLTQTESQRFGNCRFERPGKKSRPGPSTRCEVACSTQ